MELLTSRAVAATSSQRRKLRKARLRDALVSLPAPTAPVLEKAEIIGSDDKKNPAPTPDACRKPLAAHGLREDTAVKISETIKITEQIIYLKNKVKKYQLRRLKVRDALAQ